MVHYYMKRRNYYIVLLLSLVTAFTACKENEPDLFDESHNGAYFDYEYAADFDRSMNFAEYLIGNPDTVTVTFKVKLLGYLTDDSRVLSVKTKAIEGYEQPDIVIDEVVFANKEYEKDVVVKVRRPDVEDVVYGVCIYLDGSGDIGTGINGKNEVNLYVTESHEKPLMWERAVEEYLGEWSREKHRFLAEHTGDNHYFDGLYDETGNYRQSQLLELNVSAVNALLASEPAEPITVDLPILAAGLYPDYRAPFFWKDCEQYLGAFRVKNFCRFTAMMGGSNTRDIIAMFASSEAVELMKKESGNFHKSDVLDMLNTYYDYALMGYPISEYRNLFWVELRNGVNYEVRIPFWWEDPNGLGTAAIVKKYFGEYDKETGGEKYKFMLNTMMKEDGAESFIAESIFPFIYDKENSTYAWDESQFGTKQLSGEERLKECYRVIKAANKNRPPSRRFDIPDVDID